MDMIQIGALVAAGILVLSNYVDFKDLSGWVKGKFSKGIEAKKDTGEYNLVEAVDKFSELRNYLALHKRDEAVESLDVVFSLLNEE